MTNPISPIDPVDLTAKLVQCASITPVEGGALILLETLLTDAGFDCTRVDRGDTSNLFARWGTKGNARTFGFNGHTDVVPLGDESAWTVPPFGAIQKDGYLWGRGATDMKSGVAAFVAAAIDMVADTPPDGAIIITITGDEEGPALDGTLALLDYLDTANEAMTVCLVGEPTCPNFMGEMMKIGRRGSMNAHFNFTGVQGHSAYPHQSKNPVAAMARLMDRLGSHQFDEGTDEFDPSHLAVVTMDTGNPATNIIPANCTSALNIRFNDLHTGASLTDWMQSELDIVAADTGVKIDMAVKISGESFLTPEGPLSDLVGNAVFAELSIRPKLSTSGGTSDARFVKSHCPVVEFGLEGKTMHQVDERVEIKLIHQLKSVYGRILRDYFA